ncbi:transglycosylase SLT domain-containing protein [Roseomonas populi]|uniref:Transglycosylase SLT domain-containing protein n=1 Tax=Roseomonas populi TaxID=3121582 RepID=A0ABT1WYD6_9PROT|nr:transglycosylase SLT domain-containing protein [Roseomonas pecuniae]MCR0980858.1 transglycosylase SLT domain-containing protein [Roseomonas pecuniae]
MLASTLIVGLGSLAAGCATAEDAPQLASGDAARDGADQAPATGTEATAGRRLAPGFILASSRRPVRNAAATSPVVERRDIDSPRAACLDAVRQAERAHDIPEGLMVAVALAESGLHAHAMNIGGRAYFPDGMAEARRIYNSARPGQYVMAGCVQVNARVHARNSDWPLDPWRSADWGAGYLRQHYEKAGNWADAIRRWNGGGASGDRLACRVMAKLKVSNPGSSVLSDTRCGATNIARERRNGEALLEVAEAAD